MKINHPEKKTSCINFKKKTDCPVGGENYPGTTSPSDGKSHTLSSFPTHL